MKGIPAFYSSPVPLMLRNKSLRSRTRRFSTRVCRKNPDFTSNLLIFISRKMDLRDKNNDYQDNYASNLPNMNFSAQSSMSPYLNIDPSYLNQGGAEFVFPTDSKKRRGWGERMFSSIGTSYMLGLATGGSYGLYEGLRNPDGKTYKLRLNSVLNGCTRRGPFLANSLGILALMYCSLDTLIGKVRGEEDQLNSIAAATGAGMIFKSTAGARPIAIAGAIGGSLAAAYHFGEKLLEGRGQTMSTPNWA